MAFVPPTVPGAGEFNVVPATSVVVGTPGTGAVIPTGSVLNMAPENRSPATANGIALCMRKLPRKPFEITSVPKTSLTNFATC